MERNILEYTYNINLNRQYDEKVFFCCFDLFEPDIVTASFFLSNLSSFVSRYTGDYDLNCLCILDKPGDRGCVW